MKKSSHPRAGRLSLAQTGLLLASSILLVGGSPRAAGQAIYSTKFEPNTFLEDTVLVGQDGWLALGTLSPNAAVVTADNPRQGKQSVHVLGADLEQQDLITDVSGGYYNAIGSYWRPVNHDTGNAQTLRVSAHVRIDGPPTAPGHNFFSASIGVRAETTLDGEPSSADVGELAISSDGHAYACGGNDFVPAFLASVPVTLGQWYSLAVVADFATQTSAFYVDDVLLTMFAWEPGEVYTGVLLGGAFLAYAAPDTATNKKSDYASSYDKFSINVVNEPRSVKKPFLITFEATSTGTTGSLQTFTVPRHVHSLIIEVWGAQGGLAGGGNNGGARMKGTFTVTPGTVLKILVGQQGQSGSIDGVSAAGGGGTFVVDSSNNPLIIAGGGGGIFDGSTEPMSQGTTDPCGVSGSLFSGGCSGNGGGPGHVGAGAGLLTDAATCDHGGSVAQSFLHGGVGGIISTVNGGYGGGGATEDNRSGGGGGGGYSGGASGDGHAGPGGGGGSFNSGTNQSNSSGVRMGNGLVVITY